MSQEQLCEYLSWDSEFFGVRIARIRGHTLNADQLENIASWCSQNQIECLYFLAEADHYETIRLAEENGFHQVDIRVTLQRDLTDWHSNPFIPDSDTAFIRPAEYKDLPTLKSIARNSYGLSRFYFDPCFSENASAALYEEWIKKSIHGYADIVLVAEQDGEIVGYITGSIPPAGSPSQTPGQIGLVGIAASARNQGVGSALTHRILDWFYGDNVSRVNIITQGRNISAQRLYQRAGFLTHSIHLWYHKWLVDCNAGNENDRL